MSSRTSPLMFAETVNERLTCTHEGGEPSRTYSMIEQNKKEQRRGNNRHRLNDDGSPSSCICDPTPRPGYGRSAGSVTERQTPCPKRCSSGHAAESARISPKRENTNGCAFFLVTSSQLDHASPRGSMKWHRTNKSFFSRNVNYGRECQALFWPHVRKRPEYCLLYTRAFRRPDDDSLHVAPALSVVWAAACRSVSIPAYPAKHVPA